MHRQDQELHPFGHAIVIGAGIGGLLAARVLSDHFTRVTIIERDTLPNVAAQRNGAPQARHLHVLLARGQQILKQLFPAIEHHIDSLGAPRIRWGSDVVVIGPAGRAAGYEGGISTWAVTRPALEAIIRQYVRVIPNITFVERTDADGLITEGNRVIGVRIASRDRQAAAELRADLVVDASGRGSQAAQWLQAFGYELPEEEMVDHAVQYATRVYEARPDVPWRSVSLRPDPDHGVFRGGVIYPAEGNRWIVTLTGVNGDYPSNDEAAFLDFSRGLISPIVYDAIKDATPLSPVVLFRHTGSRRRHYERLKHFPDGFILIGDAVTVVNPVYGQGMTVAALEADLLGQMLLKAHGDLAGFATRFQKKLAGVVQDAWALSTGEDKRYVRLNGDQRDSRTLLQRYADLLLAATSHDGSISRVFSDVINLIRRPTALFAPGVMWRVFRFWLLQRRAIRAGERQSSLTQSGRHAAIRSSTRPA